MTRLRQLLLAAACLAAASAGSARGETPTGRIHGFVVGPDGARLPGAALVLHQRSTGTEVRLAGELGLFQSPDLAPGSWDIRIALAGFAPREVHGVEVEAGRERPIDLVLTTVAMSEFVAVTGTAPRDSLEAPRIRESGARDVGEALGAVAGVTKVRKGGIANEVVLRGLQSRDLSVLVDGQRVHGAWPQPHGPRRLPRRPRRGRPRRGGQGALRRPQPGQSRRHRERRHAGPGPGLARNATAVGGLLRIPEPVAHAGPRRRAGLRPRRLLLAPLGGLPRRSGRPFTASANYRPGAADGDAFAVGTGWGRLVVAPSEGHRIDFAYTAQRSDWMDDRLRVSSAGTPRGYSMGTMARTRAWEGRLQATHGATTAGFEGYSRTWDATNEMAGMHYMPQAMIPDVTVEVAGLFVEHDRTLRPGWQLDLGARLDRARSAADGSKANTDLYQANHSTRPTSANDTLPSAKARLTWRHDGLEATAGIGHAGRVPEPNERYLALRHMGTDWVGDPGLVPSRNTGLDARPPTPGPGFGSGGSWSPSELQTSSTATTSKHLSYQRDPFRAGTLVPESGRNSYIDVSIRFPEAYDS